MTVLAPEVKPAGGCSNYAHYRLAIDTNIERRPNCDRKLWRRPPQKCAKHGVWFCAEGCFTQEQFATFEGTDVQYDDGTGRPAWRELGRKDKPPALRHSID